MNALDILFAHDRWATEQLLTTCERLTPEQFHQRFDLGPGSLHDTLTHIVGAIRAWTDTLAGGERRPRIEEDGQRRTPADLRSLLAEAYEAFVPRIRQGPPEELVTHRMRTGGTFQIPRVAVAVHVTTHGMHHRAQCLNMLRHVGVTPLPPSSVTEWVWVAQGK